MGEASAEQDRLTRWWGPAEGPVGRDATDIGGAGSSVEPNGQDVWVPEAPSDGRHRPRPVRWLRVPASLRSLDLLVARRAVLGVLLIGLIAALVLGARVWWQEARAEPASVGPVAAADHEPASTGPAALTPATQPTEPQPTTEPEPSAPAELLVHVAGEVLSPAVVQVPPGARVQDAIDAAGGLTAAADPAGVNLARPVTDGERIWIGAPGQSAPPADPAPAGSSAGAGGQAAQADEVIDLNAADQAGLETLPGIGPVTAERILAWREEHGRFSTVEELLEVSGIGERTLEQLLAHVRV